ncbi:MAG: hypothetical protein A2283_13570 [Lentisphaerae bacterium RIFOXYA12_FULL_48_11]|nr:MAG: hypothetical protein A2283_13570 [Lentisphaerae bacterium RIFOXYA12_FULL_48_11]
MQGNTGKLSAWLQLIRLPNLLTVPGDPLAGYFLAATCCGAGFSLTVVYTVLASLFFYTFGLISNDLFDLREDRQDRPGRPLPSGRITPLEVSAVAIILVIVALITAAMTGRLCLLIAGILVFTITLYNFIGKKIAVFGPLNMGLCRGLSLLLGASAVGMAGITCSTVLFAVVLLTVYIAAVTFIAAKETVQQNLGSKRWWPVFSIFLFLVPLCWSRDVISHTLSAKVFSGCLIAAALFWSWKGGDLLAGTPAPGVVPAVIGRFIQGLLLVQAMLLSLCNWPAQIAAGMLILIFPVFSILARRFYSS